MSDIWSETALVSISPSGSGEILFSTRTESIDSDIGEKGVEWIATLAGGRLSKFTPQADTSITLDLYPLEVGTTWPAAAATINASGIFDIMDGASATATTGVRTVQFDRTRLPIRLTIMWTDGTQTDPTAAINNSAVKAMRFSFAEGYLTTIKPSFTDKGLKFTATAKFPAFNSAGTACAKFDSKDSTTGTLAALTAYVTGATTLF
jgi:hypothetical protein